MTPLILAAMIVDRTAFEVIYPNVGARTLDPITGFILAGIARYYQVDANAEYIHIDTLRDQIVAGLANPKHAPEISQQLEMVAAMAPEVSSKNVKEVFRIYKEDAIARQLAATLASSNRTGAQDLMEEYLKLNEVADFEKEPELTHLIAERFNKEGLMPFMPLALNEALDGGFRKEHHLLIFGRPEQGKSLIALNASSGLARFGAKGIFFENEDRTDDTRLRIWCNLSGMNKDQIRANPRLAQEKARDNGIGNIRVQPLSPGTPGEIKYFVKSEKPDFIVVNQIRNLHVKAGTRTEQLERAATEMRNVGKKMGVGVISITQAGDSATDKLILEQGDVDGSNCLAEGTPVMMADGSLLAVENIRSGDRVLGMDGTSRDVLCTGSGTQPMYRVDMKNGDTYTVNESHIMVVKNVDTAPRGGLGAGCVGNIPLRTLLNKPYLLQHLKGVWCAETVFPDSGTCTLPIDPYLYGLWLADGFSHTLSISTSDTQLRDHLLQHYAHKNPKVRVVNGNNSIVSFDMQANGMPNPNNNSLRELGALRNKHIPHVYKVSSVEDRYALLAGLVDGDGSRRRTGSGCDLFTIFTGPSVLLKDDVVFLCKSLGFYTSASKSGPNCWAVRISGAVSRVPVVLDRKKASRDNKRNTDCSSIHITQVADSGRYYGITVNGDERYVLGNFVITHNTGIPSQMDAIVGVGGNAQYDKADMRHLSMCKNKIGAGKRWDKAFKIDRGTSSVLDGST